MPETTPKDIKLRKKLESLVRDGGVSIIENILELEEKLEAALAHVEEMRKITEPTFKEVLEQVRGRDGSNGEKGEKGEEGDRGLPGLSGSDGRDGRDGRDGTDGKDGADGKNGTDGKDGSPDTGKQIVDKINDLPTDEAHQIDAIHIKNLPKATNIQGSPNYGGAGALVNMSDVNAAGILTGQVLQWNGTQFVPVTVSGGTGYTKETPTGALYNQVTGLGGITFTVTSTPVYIVADGATFFENAGYTRVGTTITMTNPVTQYIRSFY